MTGNSDSLDALSSDSDDSNNAGASIFDRPRPFTVPRPPCDACNTNIHDGLYTACLGDEEFSVCDECLEHLVSEVERYYWWERMSEEQYNRAAEFLRSRDEVWCVKDHAYATGEMWVHTPYCDASIVSDVCDHFGFHIYWFGIVEPEDHEFDCVHKHGPCVEINLDYNNHVQDPFPLEYDILDDVNHHEIERLTESHKMFTPNE